MEPRVEYSAPWGRSVRWITGLVTGGILVLGVTLLVLTDRPQNQVAVGLTFLFVVLIFGGTAGFAVRGYRLVPGGLEIQRPGWTTRISLAGLSQVEKAPGMFQGFGIKVGNGGFLGFVGWFWTHSEGWFRAWVTDPKRAIRLRFPDRVVVVSPDDPDAFLVALQRLRSFSVNSERLR
ncbi:MAG: hypothetical protein J0M24_05415 [Verrucomicrobia bacterium]|nr:hypothetical protein [Verrucomicrobiota bacterium]